MIIKETWGRYLESIMEENADRIAVIDIQKNVRCTYRDLTRRSREIEKALIGYGVTRGTHVAMVLPSSSKWLAIFLAMINIGAVPVCLNHDVADEELKFRLKHSESKVVFTNEATYEKIRNMEQELQLEMVVIENRQCKCSPGVHIGWNTFLAQGKEVGDEDIRVARDQVQYDDPLTIQYTSGTTGMPKAVVSVHYRVLSNMLTFEKIFQYTKEDKILSSLPMYHVMGCFFSALLTFIVGGSLVLMGKFNTERVIQALIDEKCTSIHAVPTMYKLILQKLGEREITSLKKGMMGGSYCDRETVEEIRERMHIEAIMPQYGQSEACGYTQVRIGDPMEKVFNTVGRPAEGVEIKILDSKERELPVGETGEVVIRSDYCMAGYYKNDEATNKTIVDGWLHTGDLGRLDEEGYLKIMGRKKDIIIRGGENISPISIEEVLKKHYCIRDVAIVGIPDKIMGQEVGAFIILDEQEKGKKEEEIVEQIKDYAREHLAKYEQPKYIKIINKFPLTGSGKIQKFKLVNMI